MSIDFDSSDDGLEDFHDPFQSSDDVSQAVYLKACRLFKVTPSNYFHRNLTSIAIPLQNHAVGASGAKAIATALVTNVCVTQVNLSSTGIGLDGLISILEMLQENTTITDLNLSCNNLRSKGAKLLTQTFITNQNIRILDISGSHMSDGKNRITVAHVCCKKRQWNNFTDDDSGCLAEIIEENIFLREFRISRNAFGESAGCNFGKALETNSTLTRFDISWNHFRHQGAIDLCYGIQENIGLQSINLSWNGFGLEGCHELGKILKINRTLTELDLSSNRVNHDAFKLILRGVVKNKSLKILKIGINPITTDGATSILRAIADERCRSLTHLDMSEVSVDSDFVTLLRKVQKKRFLLVKHGIELRHDDIRKGDVPVVLDTDDPVTILFECMKTKNLRLIDLLKNLDKDNSDTLSREELRRGLEEIDVPLSQRSMDILMTKLDINKDGQIDFGELAVKYKEHLRRVAKLRKEADVDLKHYKNFDRLEQLREAVRLRLSLSSTASQTT